MFSTSDGTDDEALEGGREARRRELRALFDELERVEQRKAQIAREAAATGDWQTAAMLAEPADWVVPAPNDPGGRTPRPR
jgi:hypothetical protein